MDLERKLFKLKIMFLRIKVNIKMASFMAEVKFLIKIWKFIKENLLMVYYLDFDR